MRGALGGSGPSPEEFSDHERSVLSHAHEAFVAIDAGGFVIDWNPQAERTFGWPRREAIGRVLGELIIPPRYREAHWQGLQHYLKTGEGPVLDQRLELSAIDRSGREFPVELTIWTDPTPHAPRFYAFLHEISERRLSERLLRAQHAVTQVFATARSSGEAISGLLCGLGEAMDWRVGAWWFPDAGADVLRCRSLWCCEPGIAEQFEARSLELELGRGVGLPGRVWASGEPAWTADVVSDANFPRAQVAARAGLHGAICIPLGAAHESQGVLEFYSDERVQPDSATRDILATIAIQIGGFVALLIERSELVGKLERLALTDELTGLGNRRAWEEGLGRELARARREGKPVCVAILDFDRFKRFNDSHGHQAGDRLLREVAGLWRSQLRESDLLARYGGEEFALLFPGPVKEAREALERLRSLMPEGQTCSAGLALYNGYETATSLVGRADAALYEAKAAGRDRVALTPEPPADHP